jgi:long-chain fatty acid transport protein
VKKASLAGTNTTLSQAIGVLAILAGPLQLVFGGGFQIPTQSARAAGQADAFTAQADDPSAIYYNPAGLTQFQGTQLTAGLYTLFPSFEFTGPSGDASNNDPAYIPHFYLASDLGQRDWRFGLGVNTVFGLNEDWGDEGPLSQAVTNADLNVINTAPTITYELNQQWSVGASANVYSGNIELNSKLPLPVGPEGDFRFEGDDYALGATVGTLWKISDQHSIGLVYRSPFTLDFDGSAQIERPLQPSIGPSDASASVEFPQIIVGGYAYRPTRQLTLEADVQWADWETLNSVAIKSDDSRFSSLPPRQFDYESSFTYRFGAQYQLDRNWTIRGGYLYSQTSSPERTFSPVVVDLDSHVFTVGLGCSQPTWAVDLAYRYILGVNRDIDSSINSPPGEYSDQTHAIVLSLTLKF